MRYMIYDGEGNALGVYSSRIAAEAGLRGLALSGPGAAEDLVLMLYHDDGRFTGRALTIHDLPPTVRTEPTPFVTSVTSSWTPPSWTPALNEYLPLVMAGLRDAESLVRPQGPVVPAGHH